MSRDAKRVLCQAIVPATIILLAGCSSGPSEKELIAACMKEGARDANKALRREMGAKSEVFCNCAAKQAAATLPAEARRAMILDMEGKRGEASAITSKMSEPDKMAFMKGTIEIFGKCARG